MKSKYIFAGVGGASLGALFAWALTADYYENKMSRRETLLGDLLRKRTAEVIDLSSKLLDGPHLDLDDDEEDDELSPEARLIEDIRLRSISMDEEPGLFEDKVVPAPAEELEDATAEADVADETVEETRSNLQNLIDTYTANPDDHDTFVNRVRTYDEVDRTPPFVISVGDYAHDEEGEDYAKITLRYFPTQRTLLDDGEEPIDDINAYVGWKNLNRFGDESGDSDVVFVRNRALLTDFEVVREDDGVDLPLHVKYGMTRPEFEVSKASGVLKLRPEDQ